MWTRVSRCGTFAGSYGSPRPRSIAMWPSVDVLQRPREQSIPRHAPAPRKRGVLAYKISPMHRESQIGLQSRELEAADALSQFLGLPTGRGGSAPAPGAPQRPLGAPPSVIIPPAGQSGLPAGTGQPGQPPEEQPTQ